MFMLRANILFIRRLPEGFEISIEHVRSHVVAPRQDCEQVLGMEARRGADDLPVPGHCKPYVGTEILIVRSVPCRTSGSKCFEVYDVTWLISASVFHWCWFPRNSRMLVRQRVSV